MAAIGAYVFWTSVNTAELGVTDRAIEGNQFAARAEAQQMALETEHRWRVLEFEAADPRLREWLLAGSALKDRPDVVRELDAWLAARRAKYNQDFRKEAQASLWTAVDRGGYNRGMNPPFPQFRHQYFGHRDYFTGLGRNVDEKVNPPPNIIAGPHRSVVYRRRSTKTWAVTFSVPVPGADAASGPAGVLAMSVDLKSEETPDEMNRFSVLVDTRPDANGKPGLVVRHPYMATLPADADEENLPLYYSNPLVELARKREPGWQLQPDYRDPVEREAFAGLWLAAVEPVVIRSGNDKPVDIGFLIVVQERRDAVMQPVRDLQERLTIGAFLAVVFVILLLTVLTFGLLSVLDGAPKSRVTRFLRRWAGLSTGTIGTGTAGTGTAGAIGSVGGKTLRAGATPSQGSGDRNQES